MGIVIFGTGKILEKYKEQLDFEAISCFVDNDQGKQNTLIYGKKIISPEFLCGMTFDQVVIFSTTYFFEIRQQLIHLHISDDKIISWYFWLDKVSETIREKSDISSWELPLAVAGIMAERKLHRVLDMGGRLPAYSVMTRSDRRLRKTASSCVWDSYNPSSREEDIGISYNVYDHCYRKKAEIYSQCYDAVFFLDPFLWINLDDLKIRIEQSFHITNCVILNIPDGIGDMEWNRSAFSKLGQVDMVCYYFASFIVIRRKKQKRDFCKIFVVTHKAFSPPEDALYIPLYAGAEGKDVPGYMRDDENDNISSLNPWINECTALYWIWKHVDCEYIGLNHYRRYFIKEGKSACLANILNEKDIAADMRSYDVLIARADQSFPNHRIYQVILEHVDQEAYAKGLHIIRGLLAERQPEYLQTFDELLDSWSFYPCNMFVMKKAVMDVYCEWLFSFLIDAAKAMDIRPYDDYSKRIIGFFAERMLTVWLMHHKLKVKECQILLLDQG